MLRWRLAPCFWVEFHLSQSSTTAVPMSPASLAASVNYRLAPGSCMSWVKQSEAKIFRTVTRQSVSTNPAATEEHVSGRVLLYPPLLNSLFSIRSVNNSVVSFKNFNRMQVILIKSGLLGGGHDGSVGGTITS